MTASKDNFFKPGKRGSRGKNGVSEHKAMQMAAADADERARKTERLRKLREASLQAPAQSSPSDDGSST